MQQQQKNYKRIVIKVGSSLFYTGAKLEISRISEIASVISALIQQENKELIIVSSGAIALGMNLMNAKSRPKELPLLQAAAAIGQNALMDNYSRAFRKHGINCAQILLTWDDFCDRKRYLNAKNTLLTLLKLASIPIVNENDTVSTDEIRFGDNDRLSALVATMVSADLLIILSDVDGLLNRNKELIRIVPEITAEIKDLASPSERKTSVGGMITKIQAARIASDSGIACVIANGRTENLISKIVNDPFACAEWTVFSPKKGLAERERWIAFGTKAKGNLIIDDGAKCALINKKSLLSVGVVACEGVFAAGDIVSVRDKQGKEIARGKIGVSHKKLEEVKGRRFDKEIIHRDNIVIL